MDIFPPAKQRPALLALRDALGCRDNALRRDECGDWRINGKRGHIYAIPDGFQIVVQCETAREWSYARKALKPFAALANDGDEEGVLFLDRLPTVEEAETIRQYVGVAKKRVLSDEGRERLVSLGHRFEKRSDVEGGDQDEKTASDDMAGLMGRRRGRKGNLSAIGLGQGS
jgi:hypothetical protein